MEYISHNVFCALFPSATAAKQARLQLLSVNNKLSSDLRSIGPFLFLGADGCREGLPESYAGDDRRHFLQTTLNATVPWVDFTLRGDYPSEGPYGEEGGFYHELLQLSGSTIGQFNYSNEESWPSEGFNAIVIAAVGSVYPYIRSQVTNIDDLFSIWSSQFPSMSSFHSSRCSGYCTAFAGCGPLPLSDSISFLARAIQPIKDIPFCAMALRGKDWSVIAGSTLFLNDPAYSQKILSYYEASELRNISTKITAGTRRTSL